MRERILITGPAGRVGSQIIPLLRQHFALRLLDTKPIQPESDDQLVQADITDFNATLQACGDLDTLVHLAATSDEADFHSLLLPNNLAGTYNVFEAARQAGLRKIVFASTGQTVLNYSDQTFVTTEMPARPATVYACTKLFGEALGRLYSDRHQLSVICLRICWFQPYDSPLLRTQPHMLPKWCSPRDLTQIIVKSIRTPLPFGIFFAISNNTGRHWDISNAQELLDYQPEDHSAL